MISLARVDAIESQLCLKINRFGSVRPIRTFFAAISRLGDWPFWVIIGAVFFALYGSAAVYPGAHIIVTVAIGVALYKALKNVLVRERPYVFNGHIVAGTPALDRYSFPSGHTQHAFCITAMLATYAPELLIVTVPFTLLVAASRVILGLHYPTDVIAGAALGLALAKLSMGLFPLV
ncbi:MAG: phosphatase PAP2 family protein [Pseudomonadota bacterium]